MGQLAREDGYLQPNEPGCWDLPREQFTHHPNRSHRCLRSVPLPYGFFYYFPAKNIYFFTSRDTLLSEQLRS